MSLSVERAAMSTNMTTTVGLTERRREKAARVRFGDENGEKWWLSAF